MSLPKEISHLADNSLAGAAIELRLEDPTYQFILHNYSLPEVRDYTRELRKYVELGVVTREHDQTTSDLNHTKSRMVSAVLAFHKTVRKGSPADLRKQLVEAKARIAELESANRALTAALARTKVES